MQLLYFVFARFKIAVLAVLADCLYPQPVGTRAMAMEAALHMLDGREFEMVSAVVFRMVGFVLSQIFCKSHGVNVMINGNERHGHGYEEVNALLLTTQLSVSRGVETTQGPLEVLVPPTFWKEWPEVCRAGTVARCSPLCHNIRGKALSRVDAGHAKRSLLPSSGKLRRMRPLLLKSPPAQSE